ncbi:hypothetical protein TPA0598_11_01860 [Streptomyces lydicamycinicus]|uniref:Uncharacterized protein n=1 Tax=Streptomyces lydicamycinicus TaxID=1546107 RepID=A0A0P4RHC0_9ACTN|nr:hypothetical protein TPA0598_11_01860 [Streptomyces lydicamycinicus]
METAALGDEGEGLVAHAAVVHIYELGVCAAFAVLTEPMFAPLSELPRKSGDLGIEGKVPRVGLEPTLYGF